MAVLGELNEIREESVICEWKLKDFSSLLADVDVFYHSPEFVFAGATWSLRIYPNGQTKASLTGSTEYVRTDGSIDLLLVCKSSGLPIKLQYSLGVKTLDEKIDAKYHTNTNTFENEKGYGFYKVMRRTKVLERKSEFLPSDTLTVVCKLKLPISPKTEKTFDAGTLSSREKSYMNKLIKCPYCFDDLLLKDWLQDHECQVEVIEDLERVKKRYDAISMLKKTVKEKDDIKKQLDAYKADVVTFKTSNESLLKEKLDLEKYLEAFKEDLDDLRNENISLKKTLEVAEASNKQSVNEIRKERAAHQEEIKAFLDALKNHQADDLRNESILIKKTLEVAEASISATKQSVDEIRKERAAHQEEMKTFLDALKNHQAGGIEEDAWSSNSSDSSYKDDSNESSFSDNKESEPRPPESDTGTADCSYCKGTFDDELISSHEKKCVVQCPKCLNDVFYQNWFDHECPRARGSLFRSWISMLNFLRY